MEHVEEQLIIKRLLDISEDAPNRRERARLMVTFSQEASQEAKKMLLEAMIMRIGNLGAGLREARDSQAELAETIRNLTAPPFYPYVFRGMCATSRGDQAIVSRKGAMRIVSIDEEVDTNQLVVGDEVLLGSEMNVIMGVASWGPPRCGGTALFDRFADDGRLILKSRDEEFLAEPAGRLDVDTLQSNDEVRWDRDEELVYEKIERSKGSQHFLQAPPSVTFDDIGGLDEAIAKIKDTIELHMRNSDIVDSLHLEQIKSILLEGPPGGGKTMLAQALANWLGEVSQSGKSRFMSIKPGELLSMWFGQSEANIRELFRVAREEGERNPNIPVVIFIDEVDSIGHSRGSAVNQASDRVAESFMTELDGLKKMGNIIVIAATNRANAMSEAIIRPGRLGDDRIVVSRPNMSAARDILAKHLRPDLPYERSNGSNDQGALRQGVINAAVSSIFAPNGSNALAKVTMRDNTRRIVTPCDMLSGAVLQKIARVAVKALALRMVAARQSGHPSDVDLMGVRVGDVLTAINDEFATAASVLTRDNIRRYITDLPQGTDVTGVELLARRVAHRHKYINLSVA